MTTPNELGESRVLSHGPIVAPQERAPASRVRFLVLGAACVLAIITYIHRAGFQSISTELLNDLRMDIRHLSYMTVAFMVAYGLFEVPWGWLGDRFGSKHLLMAVVLGGSAMTAGVGLAGWLPKVLAVQLGFLLVLRFLFGVFQAGTFPLLSRVMADWMPTTERGLAQGCIWMASRVGGMLAPILMVGLLEGLGNWRYPLAIGGGLGLFWCLAVWPWFRDRPEQSPWVNETELGLITSGRASKKPASHHGAPWGAMLRSTNVWALWMMYGFLGYSGNFFMFLNANYLEDYRHFDKDTAKWLTVVPFSFGVLACVSGGVLSDRILRHSRHRRWGRRLVGGFGMALAGTMILLTPWVESAIGIGVVYALIFIGNDLAMGPAWAAASDIGERHAGTLAGAMNMMASLMAAVAAIVTGELLHRDSLTLPFVIFSASYFLGALCWLRVDVTETIPQGAD